MRHSTWTCNFIHDRLLGWYKILFKIWSWQTYITWSGLYIYADNVQQCLTIDLKAIEKNINIIHLWYLQRVFPSLRDKNKIFLIYTIYHFRPTQWSKVARGKEQERNFTSSKKFTLSCENQHALFVVQTRHSITRKTPLSWLQRHVFELPSLKGIRKKTLKF